MADIRDKWPWPTNIGTLGTYPEEIKQLQKTEKNPDAAPMPDVAPVRLLSPTQSSDNLRMGEPAVPVTLIEGLTSTLTHVVLRRVLSKARRRGAVLFDEAVDGGSFDDLPGGRHDQMKKNVARERALFDLLDRYNALAEDVYTRLLATAKG
jgi:hypothetical protein